MRLLFVFFILSFFSYSQENNNEKSHLDEIKLENKKKLKELQTIVDFRYLNSAYGYTTSCGTTYKGKLFTGKAIKFNSNGIKSEEVSYDEGNPYEWIEYYDKGNIKSLMIGWCDSEYALKIEFYKNGTLKSEYDQYFGLDKWYHPNGSIAGKTEYKNWRSEDGIINDYMSLEYKTTTWDKYGKMIKYECFDEDGELKPCD
tara:strand:+ start:57 stop:656 length:600 start_codon:yes stop_codon:yes gene_type:complete